MSSEIIKHEACRPPPGQTYLTIGQDLFSFSQYVDSQYNASLHRGSLAPKSTFWPAAAMFYTDIQALKGLDKPADYGSGIEYANGIFDSLFVNAQVGLQVGLWLHGSRGCRQIVRGELDDQIQQLMNYLVHCPASKVFLRVGYEFDNPSFGYSADPDLYKQAFSKLYQAGNNHDKVYFVWHSWGAKSNTTLDEFYPGNHVVDWVGVSLFSQAYSKSALTHVERVLDFAEQHGKPTMIAESTPFGGIKGNSTWKRWFEPTLSLIERFDIDMWCYIDCDWTSQPMWYKSGFGDTRLSINEYVMNQWHSRVLQNKRFLGAGSLATCGRRQSAVERLELVNSTMTSQQYRHYEKEKRQMIAGVVFLIGTVVVVWIWRRRQRRLYLATTTPHHHHHNRSPKARPKRSYGALAGDTILEEDEGEEDEE